MISLPQATLGIAAELTTAAKGRRAASQLGDRLGSRLIRNSHRPVDVHTFATSQGIEVVQASALAESGRIEWTRSGLRVALSEKESPRRQRFTLAHELGHHLIFGIDKKEARAYSGEEETRCDMFAAALLMPKQTFSCAFNSRQSLSPVSVVRELADEFGVSLLAAMIRLRDLELMDPASILLMLRVDQHGDRRVAAAAYDKATYRRLEQMTTRDLHIEDEIGRTISALTGARSAFTSVRLPRRQRGLPHNFLSVSPAELVCVPLRGDGQLLLAGIDLLAHPLRRRVPRWPYAQQAELPEHR